MKMLLQEKYKQCLSTLEEIEKSKNDFLNKSFIEIINIAFEELKVDKISFKIKLKNLENLLFEELSYKIKLMNIGDVLWTKVEINKIQPLFDLLENDDYVYFIFTNYFENKININRNSSKNYELLFCSKNNEIVITGIN